MSDTPQYKAHLFICTNQKAKGDCCAPRGAQQLRDNLKERLQKDPKYKGLVRVNASGCLGPCARGINAVLYPQGQWFQDLTPEHEDDLYQAVVKALES